VTTVGVFAAVQNYSNRNHCVRHNYGQHDWGMPGGQLEAGEDPVACVKREIYEETGTEVEVTHLVGACSAPY
jgi:8-oxo-dGTP pyrophosphatase MutT (NUDIX family)